MKKRVKLIFKKGVFVVSGLLLSTFTFCQVNFSGSWAFNESKSNLGEGGNRMVSQNLVIAQKDNNLTLERSFTGQDGTERKMNETYTLDGKECVNPVFNTSKKSTAKWSPDKKSLSVSSVIVFEMNGETNEIKTIEVYKLGDTGKILSIDSQLTSTMGERKTLLIYDKK